MRIALLDNDKNQCKFVADILQVAGHTGIAYENTKELTAHLQVDGCDMLIIHWDLPDTEGEEAVRWARENLVPDLPILIISSSAGEDHIIAGLAAGANDYVIKPLRRGDIATRIQTLLRRAYPGRSTEYRIAFGSYIFDTRTARLVRAALPSSSSRPSSAFDGRSCARNTHPHV